MNRVQASVGVSGLSFVLPLRRGRPLQVVFCLLLMLTAAATHAAEVHTIDETYLPGGANASLPPVGKEADWILGDHLLRNDRIVAVIAKPVATRNANMTVKNVGGCVIDLTHVEAQNDQLSAYYPGGGRLTLNRLGVAASGASASSAGGGGRVTASGEQVQLIVVSLPTDGRPMVEVTYSLTDGDDFLTVTTRYSNPHQTPITVELEDRIRADRSFTAAADAKATIAWWDDEWFGQAYGLVPIGATLVGLEAEGITKRNGRDPLRYAIDGMTSVELAPGASVELVRRLVPAPSLLALRARAAEMAEQPLRSVAVSVIDANGGVSEAMVVASDAVGRYAAGRTDTEGRLALQLPATQQQATGQGGQRWSLEVSAVGRGSKTVGLAAATGPEEESLSVELPLPGIVVATISDADGGPIPCKVQFRGRGEDADGAATADPDFGPDSSHTAIKNLRYSHNGRFRQEIAPGRYDVLISYGPEYDAVTTTLDVVAGHESLLEATLHRVVDTTGWISSDFHSHSTPSGDNTSSQFGRVQNLLCEHLEFNPCTEHNRISSYTPHLERLGVAHLMATCTGMELTGSLLPVNHQNAFPLVEKRYTQDGGGPVVNNEDPVRQIERLALWDDAAEKVVQMNHPNLVQVLGDRDTDGEPDAGFEAMLGFVDVIEVHPPAAIFQPQQKLEDPRKPPAKMFTWMQMLNLGYRVPGVVNTDAHYNFHGSGWLRNYIKSPTDDPAEVDVTDIVHASEVGAIVMTNGPFLEVMARTGDDEAMAGPGEQMRSVDGKVTLSVRVQCPNWFDVDRVQVFVNGRPDPRLNFTRRENGELFSREVVRFEHTIPVLLEKDAHLIVATIGEDSQLGMVMGPAHAESKPVAVSNPIFVDTDGNGFTANGDLLDLPIPHQEKPTMRAHAHGHPHAH
jgi:hypothetical protein